jgi:hypothetical protein
MAELDALRSESQTYLGKMVISPERMERVRAEFRQLPGLRATPESDLRYIEGLLDLPHGTVKHFYCIPDASSATCACGREPNAAEVIAHALRNGVHSRQIVRDAVIGVQPIFERSDGGREAACLRCSRRIKLLGYLGEDYIYA